MEVTQTTHSIVAFTYNNITTTNEMKENRIDLASIVFILV